MTTNGLSGLTSGQLAKHPDIVMESLHSSFATRIRQIHSTNAPSRASPIPKRNSSHHAPTAPGLFTGSGPGTRFKQLANSVPLIGAGNHLNAASFCNYISRQVLPLTSTN